MVSPDVGGVVRARAFAKWPNGLRSSTMGVNVPVLEVMHIIGDVKDRTCAGDDIVSGGTLCMAEALMNAGAKSVYAYGTLVSCPAVR